MYLSEGIVTYGLAARATPQANRDRDKDGTGRQQGGVHQSISCRWSENCRCGFEYWRRVSHRADLRDHVAKFDKRLQFVDQHYGICLPAHGHARHARKLFSAKKIIAMEPADALRYD